MSRLVKIVNNKYVQIEEYKNPNICFNTNEYDNFEDYCTLRETFDPFEIFYENQELKKQVEEYKKQVDKGLYNTCLPYTTGYNKAIEDKETQQKEFIKYLEDEIKFHKNRDSYMVADIHGSYDLNDIELKLLEEILQKYKEITRGKDEKEN
ncbi:MAG: hypothetical protein MST00_03470 [Tenericutes bacterium]|nr:hypothetical protein [Mycoplasmatota bacterium]